MIKKLAGAASIISILIATMYTTDSVGKTVTVNGLTITTGNVYTIDDLRNGKSDSDALRAIVNEQDVLLDFHAPWCGPCRQMAAPFEQLARECEQFLFIKINVDEHEAIANQYGVRGLPTFIAIRNRTNAKRVSGSMSKERLKRETGVY